MTQSGPELAPRGVGYGRAAGGKAGAVPCCAGVVSGVLAQYR